MVSSSAGSFLGRTYQFTPVRNWQIPRLDTAMSLFAQETFRVLGSDEVPAVMLLGTGLLRAAARLARCYAISYTVSVLRSAPGASSC